MAYCSHHPQVETGETCAACSRPFCPACLTEFLGQRVCGACRDARLAAVQSAAPPTVADHIIPARNPQALIGYYLGVFSLIPCVGLVLGPPAIVLGVLGLQARRNNPLLPGRGHAITAIVLGSISTLLYGGLALLTLAGLLLGRR